MRTNNVGEWTMVGGEGVVWAKGEGVRRECWVVGGVRREGSGIGGDCCAIVVVNVMSVMLTPGQVTDTYLPSLPTYLPCQNQSILTKID